MPDKKKKVKKIIKKVVWHKPKGVVPSGRKASNARKTVKKIIPGRGSAKKAIEANLAKQKAKKLAKK